MRIALVNNFFPPRVGGSSLFVASLARRLMEQGHEVLVIAGTYGEAQDPIDLEIQVKRIPSWILPRTRLSFHFDINFCLLPGNRKKVWKALEEFRPDVIHCHGQFMDLSWKALKFAQVYKIPSLLTLHTRLFNPNRLTNILMKLLDQLIVKPKILGNPPRRWIVIDKNFSSYIKSRYGIEDELLVSLPIGVENREFANETRSPRNQRRIIASIGHVIPVRNRKALISAFDRFAESYPQYRLVIVGNVFDESLLEAINQTKMRSKIELTGALPQIEVARLLRKSIMEIHDVQDHEGKGLGIASLEAMLMGVPIISSTPLDYFPGCMLIPNLHFVPVQGDNPEDLLKAMINLVENQDDWDRISLNGSKWVAENFSMDRVTKAHLELYAELAQVEG